MKSQLTRLSAILFLFSCSFLDQSCKKSTEPDKRTTTNPPKGDTTTNSCTATAAQLENISIFPADNPWNKNIAAVALDPASSQITTGFSASGIHADFGSGTWDNAPIGIPYVAVCGSQAKSVIVFRSNSYDGNYGDESDPGPYPIPLDAPVEGNGNGDSHVIAVDKDNHKLYELYNASINNGHWEASSGAVYDLNSNGTRPAGWTSADAAGLPIFPGLVRYEEILKGKIDHPIRFTLSSSNVKPAYIAPATHKVNSSGGQYSLPFGARIRLKSSFNISGYSATNRIILQAMKDYGLILADIGSNMYISGAPDSRWNNDDLHQLGQIHGSDFEVVKMN